MDLLNTLLQNVSAAEAAQDFDAMREARNRIVEGYPGSVEAAEALYKVGLDSLFRQRDIVQSIAVMEQAAKCAHPFWAAAARTSLALCYVHQRRIQKALFELRKVAYVREPSAHSITALSFMETVLMDEQKPQEAAKIRKDRVLQLEEMLHAHRTGTLRIAERAHYLHQLALALADNKERARAKAAIEEALALGAEAVGAELTQTLKKALQELR